MVTCWSMDNQHSLGAVMKRQLPTAAQHSIRKKGDWGCEMVLKYE